MNHMQKFVLSFFFLVGICLVLFVACGKSSSPGSVSCTGVDVFHDSAALLGFAKAHGISPLTDTIGLYYKVITQGTGATPSANSTIFVTYTATLMDSTIVDSTTNPARTGFVLGGLIPGWQYGLPKIQAGGHIKLLIPSQYAYSCLGSGPIPPNTPLFFDITLVSVQ
jgi:FKBP-type peptidyl-prolyl cis-trans isomerase FkpA